MIADANSGGGTNIVSEGPAIAVVRLGCTTTVQRNLHWAPPSHDEHDHTIVAMTHFVRGLLAVEDRNAEQAAKEMEVFGVGFAEPVVRFNYPGYNCWIAPIEEAAGHPDRADQVLKSAGTFVDCFRFRADILDGRGDWPGAQKAYADAVALAPDLPAAYYSWGVALAKHGDLDGAIAKLQQANQRGPHWADPLKAWGDVLVGQGKQKQAIAKYDEAVKYAPNWKELKAAQEALGNQKS
jgi:tetratricopeptide (TPR) repeat protein